MQNATVFFAAVIPLAGVGAIQLYNQFKARDYEGVVTILVAALIGLVAGITHFYGLDIQTALTLALSAVGIHTVTKNIG